MGMTEKFVEEASISSRAMKTVFHRGMGAAVRSRDKNAESLVKQTMGDEGQVVTRRLFTNKQTIIHKRNEIAGAMYKYHMTATLPFGDDGSRLLPNAMYFDYLSKMQNYESQLAIADARLVMDYFNLVQADIAERNFAFLNQGKPQIAHAGEYPTLKEVQRHLYVKWVLEPIGTVLDFRFAVDDVIRERLTKHLNDVAANAKAEIYERMLEPMKRFTEKLAVPIGEKGAVFRNSMLTDFSDMLAMLPRLNMDGDVHIEQMLGEIRTAIAPYQANPDMLREVPAVRESARVKMEALMKRLDGYAGMTS